MAFEGKFLVDHNLPVTLCEELRRKNKSLRCEFVKERLAKEGRAGDFDILIYGGKHNFHVITVDKGFLETTDHPCGERYARRTVLVIPAYLWHDAARYLWAAWRVVTWSGLREYDAIEVQERALIAYRCENHQYVPAMRKPLRFEKD